jgi:hypothetical protein
VAQHDYVIANGTGAAVRSDINGALGAIATNNSGATEPATTYAFQLWADTTTGLLKIRNAANSAWVELLELDGEFGSKTFNGNITLNAQGDLRFADSDSSNWVAFQSPATVSSNVTWTLPSADGTNGQALTTNGSGTLSWTSPAATTDKITEGNTEAEVVDTGSDGHFKVTTEGIERFRCDSSGRLLIGTSTARSNFFNSALPSGIQFEGTSFQGRTLSIVSSENAATSMAILILAHQMSGSVGGNTAVANNDSLGIVSFQGSDGTDFVEGARIEAAVDATSGANDLPTRLIFSTTADGSSSPTERMRIANNGAISTVVPGGSTLYPAFACRAWVNFNGTGTVSIRGNGNVSSITDNGVGDYTVNFTSALADANYAFNLSANDDGTGTGGPSQTNGFSYGAWKRGTNSCLYATGSMRFQIGYPASADLYDQTHINVAIFR